MRILRFKTGNVRLLGSTSSVRLHVIFRTIIGVLCKEINVIGVKIKRNVIGIANVAKVFNKKLYNVGS